MACNKALAVALVCMVVFSAAAVDVVDAERDSKCYCTCLSQCTTIAGTPLDACSFACNAGCINSGHLGTYKPDACQ